MKEQKNKICIVCEFPPPPGGMSNQALVLYQQLTSEGFAVYKCKVNVQFPGFLSRFDFNLTKILFKLPIIFFRILLSVIRCDIIHVLFIGGAYFYIVVVPAVLLAKIFRKKVIVNYHAGYFLKFYDNSYKIIVKNILLAADAVTTPLYYLKNEFSSIGVKITRVSNVIDLCEFSFTARNEFKPKFISSRHLRSVYGNETVIQAFEIICQECPEATLTIAGDGENRRDLEELTDRLGVSERVTFTGYISKQQLLREYANADIFLNGSRRDNMPISILESFALGLPVVSTNPMGIPYLVTDGETGLLSAVDDAEALAENAVKVMKDPQLGMELARNAREYLQTLTWESVYPVLSSVYFGEVQEA